jgi:poly [ADP-ribose] polymerase
LNQSNLDHNNNKFYIIQALQSDSSPNEFYLWNRWGRVGVPGQNALFGPLPKERVLQDFEKKFHDKTVKGDYVKIEIAYDDEEDEKKEEAVVPTKGNSKNKRKVYYINILPFF